jgi:hypothetical protein
MPLAFDPGEAFQFDWSEDCGIIGNERIKLRMAHTKLPASRFFDGFIEYATRVSPTCLAHFDRIRYSVPAPSPTDPSVSGSIRNASSSPRKPRSFVSAIASSVARMMARIDSL